MYAGSPPSRETPPPHPDSSFRTAAGREVQLKVHRCFWSGHFPENSLAAIEECVRAPVTRAEIDIAMLRDSDFLVSHHGVDFGNGPTSGDFFRTTSRNEAATLRLLWHGNSSPHRPPFLSEVVATLVAIPAPTLIELDMMDREPLPWERIEELARLVQPVRERVVFNGSDWNLRRLLRVDPGLLVGFDPGDYLDWVPVGTEREEDILLPRGAYGYLDRHPLASQHFSSMEDYLSDRMSGIVRLVPGMREVHLRLQAFEHMLDDGVGHVSTLFHREHIVLDVWTLDAGTPDWRSRLARVVAAGVDIVTTNTPHEMAAAGRLL